MVVLDRVDRAEVKEKIFNPFFTTKPAGEGTGLGLSISHDIIVKQHGGSIEVDTQPGEFTEIRVILPRAAVPSLHGRNVHFTIIQVPDGWIIRRIDAGACIKTLAPFLGDLVICCRTRGEAKLLAESCYLHSPDQLGHLCG